MNMLVLFLDAKENIHIDVKFTLPGKERQDSVYSGLQVREKCFNHGSPIIFFYYHVWLEESLREGKWK